MPLKSLSRHVRDVSQSLSRQCIVLGLETPLLTNIPVVVVSNRLAFFFLRRNAVCCVEVDDR